MDKSFEYIKVLKLSEIYKMKKPIFIISILSNLVFFWLWQNSQSSFLMEKKEIKRIQNIYKQDTNILKMLLINRISKREALKVFNENLKENEFFKKPSEFGLGAGHMFFVFEKSERLKGLRVHDFSEK